MTIAEKQKAVNDYCIEHPCKTCKLRGVWADAPFRDCLPICLASEKELDWALSIINSKTEPDNVNHPKHYESGKYECIDVMVETQGEEAVKAFCLCNAFKYIYRCTKKHATPVEDVKKAIWYLNKFLELEGENDG